MIPTSKQSASLLRAATALTLLILFAAVTASQAWPQSGLTSQEAKAQAMLETLREAKAREERAQIDKYKSEIQGRYTTSGELGSNLGLIVGLSIGGFIIWKLGQTVFSFMEFSNKIDRESEIRGEWLRKRIEGHIESRKRLCADNPNDSHLTAQFKKFAYSQFLKNDFKGFGTPSATDSPQDELDKLLKEWGAQPATEEVFSLYVEHMKSIRAVLPAVDEIDDQGNADFETKIPKSFADWNEGDRRVDNLFVYERLKDPKKDELRIKNAEKRRRKKQRDRLAKGN